MQFRPIGDTIRYILSNGPNSSNLAATRDTFVPGQLPLTVALLKENLSPRLHRCTLVWWDELSLRSLASAKIRSGPRAWEIARLYLPGKGGQDGRALGSRHPDLHTEALGRSPQDTEYGLTRLLEGLTQYASARDAERMFLRIPWGSPVVNLARHTGFFPYFNESLLQGSGGRGPRRRVGNLGLRPRLPHEEYALFQLYSASTPSDVRSGLGMTFDQWRDSRERRGGDLKEEVYEREGKVKAWLGSDVLGLISGGPSLRRRLAQMELIVHPDDQEVLPALLDHALATKGVQSWLVPEYQEFQRKLLIQRGFREVASYSMLIKTMAVRVERPSLASVEARVW